MWHSHTHGFARLPGALQITVMQLELNSFSNVTCITLPQCTPIMSKQNKKRGEVCHTLSTHWKMGYFFIELDNKVFGLLFNDIRSMLTTTIYTIKCSLQYAQLIGKEVVKKLRIKFKTEYLITAEFLHKSIKKLKVRWQQKSVSEWLLCWPGKESHLPMVS